MPIPLGILAAAGAGGGGALANSFDLLQTTILGSDTASVTFSSLGSYSDYEHLQIRAALKTSDGSVGRPGIRFNGVSSAGSYRAHRLRANGVSIAGEADSETTEIRIDRVTANEANANNFTAVVWDIFDFSNNSKNTTVRSLHGYANPDATDYYIQLGSGVYLSTDAITSIAIAAFYGTNLKANSRFSLYGIK